MTECCQQQDGADKGACTGEKAAEPCGAGAVDVTIEDPAAGPDAGQDGVPAVA